MIVKTTKEALKRQLQTEYPKAFVDMLDDAKIINTLKKFTNGNFIFAVGAMKAEIQKVFEKYEIMHFDLCEINNSWNKEL